MENAKNECIYNNIITTYNSNGIFTSIKKRQQLPASALNDPYSIPIKT
jgi:hypothetical protein